MLSYLWYYYSIYICLSHIWNYYFRVANCMFFSPNFSNVTRGQTILQCFGPSIDYCRLFRNTWCSWLKVLTNVCWKLSLCLSVLSTISFSLGLKQISCVRDMAFLKAPSTIDFGYFYLFFKISLWDLKSLFVVQLR